MRLWAEVESSITVEVTNTPDINALSVGQLARQISRVVEDDPRLNDVVVRGEISNFKAHSSGHCYFTLKDDLAQIRCCLWRTNAGRLRFRPAEGDRVLALGRVEFYGKRGEISFIVETLEFDGQGALHEAFERLKLQLEAEGLFDPERKKPLPPLPRRIGLITSSSGAVMHDVCTVLQRRWPLATIVLIPAAVQGFAAAPDLVRALSWAAAVDDLDVVIMARGGGSAEDLWCFNDESLARAAAEFPKPLISAIGHETDFTILDFVADVRAATPSAAAELVAPDIREVAGLIQGYRWRLHKTMAQDVRFARQQLESLRTRHRAAHPQRRIERDRTRVLELRTRMTDAARRRVKIEKQLLQAQRTQLKALDPRRVLERGYALVSRSPLETCAKGEIVTSVARASSGDALCVLLHDGTLRVLVENVEERAEGNNS